MALEEPSLPAYKNPLGAKNLELRSVYSTTVQKPASVFRLELSFCGNTVTELKWNQCVKSFRIEVLKEQVTNKYNYSETQDHY
jgi:hypothetical protein